MGFARFFQGFIIWLFGWLPGLGDRAPSWARRIFRPAALAGAGLCVALLWLVLPSVIEALKSPDPWTREGFVVLSIVAWVGWDAVRYGRLAIGPGAPSQRRERGVGRTDAAGSTGFPE